MDRHVYNILGSTLFDIHTDNDVVGMYSSRTELDTCVNMVVIVDHAQVISRSG